MTESYITQQADRPRREVPHVLISARLHHCVQHAHAATIDNSLTLHHIIAYASTCSFVPENTKLLTRYTNSVKRPQFSRSSSMMVTNRFHIALSITVATSSSFPAAILPKQFTTHHIWNRVRSSQHRSNGNSEKTSKIPLSSNCFLASADTTNVNETPFNAAADRSLETPCRRSGRIRSENGW